MAVDGDEKNTRTGEKKRKNGGDWSTQIVKNMTWYLQSFDWSVCIQTSIQIWEFWTPKKKTTSGSCFENVDVTDRQYY